MSIIATCYLYDKLFFLLASGESMLITSGNNYFLPKQMSVHNDKSFMVGTVPYG